MSGRSHFKQVQGPTDNTQERDPGERLQEQILRKTGVSCTVVVTDKSISLKTESYQDYVLAKSAIKGSTSLPIERAE